MTDNTARVFSYMGEKKRFLQAMKNNTDGFVPVQAVKNMTRYADLVELNAFGKPVITQCSWEPNKLNHEDCSNYITSGES